MHKLYRLTAFVYILSLFFCLNLSCKKNDTIKTARAKPEKVLTDKIIGVGGSQVGRLKSIRLDQDTVYVLTESISRLAGEQLIIEEGTLVKLVPGVGITMEPGAIFSANGSVNKPIIFTSNLPAGSKGASWNGITINGKSFNNVSALNGDPDDNSGSLQYVRIEFGNLTLNSVGKGTIVDHVQVSYSDVNPSFNFLGGTFNARNLISYACGGSSDFYISNGFQGKLQFLLAHRHPFFGKRSSSPPNTLTGLYISNNENNNVTAQPQTSPQISNLTIIGPNDQDGQTISYSDTSSFFNSGALVTTGNAGFFIRNTALLGFPSGGWIIGDSNTANKVNFLKAEFTSSHVQSNLQSRVYYIRPGVYRRYTATDFILFMEEPRFKNSVIRNSGDFLMTDPFNYTSPNYILSDGSPLLSGSDFAGGIFSDPFFENVSYRGAFGKTSWTVGWTNFIPLKTQYNEPQ